jgi:hypothetical protein
MTKTTTKLKGALERFQYLPNYAGVDLAIAATVLGASEEEVKADVVAGRLRTFDYHGRPKVVIGDLKKIMYTADNLLTLGGCV